MKKTTILITALIMLFVGAPQAKAVPMYYTFAGDVTSYNDTAGFIIAQFGGSIPDTVTYTIIVDFDADGTITYNDTSVSTLADDPPGVDYFYTDAYSGDYLVSTDGGYYNADGYAAEYNYGYDFWGTNGYLYVNSEDEKLEITSPSSEVSDWAVNDTGLIGSNTAFNAAGSGSAIGSSLTLMSISSSPPPVSVPEPSTLLLLGSGLLALGMFRRMRQEG